MIDGARFHRVRHIALSLSALLAFGVAGLAGAADDPDDWLRRMSQAVELLNYEGTLVHMHGEEADVLQVVHRVENGRISERLTALDGAGREIIRNDDEVTCIFPDQQSVLVEQRKDRDSSQSPLRGSLPSAEGISSAYYHVAFLDYSRVAGRNAQIIAIRPKDSYRYGYRLWIDQATAMPLKSQLRDDQGNVVEQILFADIKLPDSIPESRVKPSLIVESFVWTRSDGPTHETKVEQVSAWLATEMPAGFTLMTAVTKMPPGGTRPMEQLVYTDGLASVSVFIEDGVAESDQAEGWSQIGAANAYTTTLEGRLVTAVGEVPARTVEMIALSVRPVASAP